MKQFNFNNIIFNEAFTHIETNTVNLDNKLILTDEKNYSIKATNNKSYNYETNKIIFDSELSRKTKEPVKATSKSYYIKDSKQDRYFNTKYYNLFLNSDFIKDVEELEETCTEFEQGYKHISKNYKVTLNNAKAIYSDPYFRYFKTWSEARETHREVTSLEDELAKDKELLNDLKDDSNFKYLKEQENKIKENEEKIKQGILYRVLDYKDTETNTIYITVFDRIEKSKDYIKLEKIAHDLKELNILDYESTRKTAEILKYFNINIKDVKK